MEFPPEPPPPNAYQENPLILKTLDENISFDNEKNQWVFTKDGQEYQYNYIISKWLKIGKHTLDEEELEEEANKEELKQIKKQKLEELKKRLNHLKKPSNTGIFISNLPDTNKLELAELFSKYGAIAKDHSEELKIKLYEDNGQFKKEGLIIFENEKSVDLAVQMMDGTTYKDHKIKVEVAKFKKQADELKNKFYEKVVVIENMFRKSEFDESLKADIEEDINEEITKYDLDDLVKINWFKKDAVITVRFKTIDLASKVIEKFNDRYYDGLKLKVFRYKGNKYV